MPSRHTRLTDFVTAHADASPDAFALVFGDSRVNYAQLDGAMVLFACSLLRIGVHRGDRVAVVSPPGPEASVALLGAAFIGAIFVGIDPRQSYDEIEAIIHDAKPQVIIGCARHGSVDLRQQLSTIMFACPDVRQLIVFGGDPDRYGTAFDDFLAQGRDINPVRVETANAGLEAEDAVAIVYVPGPTGVLKGVILSHRNVVDVYSRTVELYVADPVRLINNYPVGHLNHLGLLAHAVIAGGCQILMESVEPRDILRIAGRERITVLGQDVCMLQKLVADPVFDSANLTSLQQIWWSGGIASPRLVEKLAALPAVCSTRWGVPETAGPVTLTLPEADPKTFGSHAGLATRGYDLRAVDAKGRPVPFGEPGRIQVAGACVMSGYFNRREETIDVLDANGWLTTSYVGTLGEDGSLTLIGPLDDVYIGGGFAIHPGEIERVLEGHKAVMRAVVVGVSDAVHRQVGVAFVQLMPHQNVTDKEIEAYASERLADHAQLHKVWLRETLPEDLIGAPDRKALKADARAILAKDMIYQRPKNRRFSALDDI